MSEIYTSGSWQVDAAHEKDFRDAWVDFVNWASTQPGAGSFRLLRDLGRPGRYTSIGDWQTRSDVDDWKRSPEFRERMARVLQHVADFQPTEFVVAAAAD
jgi:heme-degrading monooxygenase HmoA